jgi:hypothetical protein
MSVAFAVNCFERTYRDVLTPAFVERLRLEQGGGFDHLYLLVSNTENRLDAAHRASTLADDPGVSLMFVDDHLDDALRTTGLTRRALQPMLWYSAAPLVAVTAIPEKWLVYWDADIYLDEPHDWITPSVAKLEGNPQLLQANPRWRLPGPDTLDEETERFEGRFAIGRGFSDQAFLVERERLAAPIYRYLSRASLAYPTVGHASIFEQRVAAYASRKNLRRATYLDAVYTHPAGGSAYPSDRLTPVRQLAVRSLRKAQSLGTRLRRP